MKKQAFYIFFLMVIQTVSSFGQLISINHLDEVVLSDVHLKKSSRSQQVKTFNDSVIHENPASLTNILRFNTPLYFKENGPGMVSSVSFRGTTASQTAVIWNGININSAFTGQTDFNTLMSSNYNNISLRSGGGSVLYGSGAIGGSVHLNNGFSFDSGFSNRLQLKYGSFNTLFGSYSGKYSSEATALQVNIVRLSSDNDFRYLNTDRTNSNGDFENYAINAAAAYIFDDQNSFKVYTNYFSGERGFSGTLYAPSRSKYEDRNSRNLLQWTNFRGDFISNLKLAYLDETYRYFENREREDHSGGRVKTGILKYDLEYEMRPEMSLTALVDINYSSGAGTNIGDAERKSGSFGLLFSHDVKNLGYEISLRKEVTDKYDSPLLFSLGAAFEMTKFYEVSFNVSRNYRIPTFNDLFWYAGGNTELQPEKSLQAEVGQKLHFREVTIEANAFIIKIDDMLRWIPGSGALWKPENTANVQNFGLELWVDWKKKLGNHDIGFSGTYAWTQSRDLDLDKYLVYVPQHKATLALAYSYKRFTSYYQQVFTDDVFTSTDNAYSLESYLISDFGIEYSFLKNQNISVGLEIKNIWNINYQIMPSRPMPGRSINSTITLNL